MQVTAEEAMYNLWSPSIFNLFLSQIRDSQLSAGAKTNAGFVAGVVPGTTSSALPGSDGKSSGLDLSWTAAYPLGMMPDVMAQGMRFDLVGIQVLVGW